VQKTMCFTFKTTHISATHYMNGPLHGTWFDV